MITIKIYNKFGNNVFSGPYNEINQKHFDVLNNYGSADICVDGKRIRTVASHVTLIEFMKDKNGSL